MVFSQIQIYHINVNESGDDDQSGVKDIGPVKPRLVVGDLHQICHFSRAPLQVLSCSDTKPQKSFSNPLFSFLHRLAISKFACNYYHSKDPEISDPSCHSLTDSYGATSI